MLTRQQGNAIFGDWPVESPSSSSSNTVCECSLKHEWLVDQSCPGCSASQSVPDVEGGRAGEWLFPSNVMGLCSVAGRDRVSLDCGQALPVHLRDRSLIVVRSSGGYVQGM